MALLRGLAVVVLLLGPAAAQPAPPQEAANVLEERVLHEHGVQTALPDGAGELGGDGDGRRSRGERYGGEARSRRRSGPGLVLPPFLAQILLWGAVGLAVVLLVAAIVRGLGGRRDAAPVAAARRMTALPTAPEADAESVPDHERLAAAGDFAAAVHAVLRHAFAVWVARGGVLPVSATAREVLRTVQRRRGPVEPLAQLVATVERVHFGGRAADRPLYDAARTWLAQWEAACAPAK